MNMNTNRVGQNRRYFNWEKMESCEKSGKILQITQKNRLEELSWKTEFTKFKLERRCNWIFIWYYIICNLTEIDAKPYIFNFYIVWQEVFFVENEQNIINFVNFISEKVSTNISILRILQIHIFMSRVIPCFTSYFWIFSMREKNILF